MMFSLYQLTSSHRNTCWSFQQIEDEGQVGQLCCLSAKYAQRDASEASCQVIFRYYTLSRDYQGMKVNPPYKPHIRGNPS